MKIAQFCGSFMTAERLIRLLQHPEQLDSIPYEELKTLVLAYPYAHHLRQLLLLKSQQIQHYELERNLSSAAAHSLDRTMLYKRMLPSALRQPVEVLELKPIQTVLRNLEAIAPVERTEMAREEIKVIAQPEPPVASTPPPVEAPEYIAPVIEPALLPESSPAADIPEIAVSESAAVEEMSAPAEEILVPVADNILPEVPETTPVMESIPENSPISDEIPDFRHWVSQFKLPAIRPAQTQQEEDEAPEMRKAPIPTREKTLAQQLAEKSVSENQGVASETLARILVKQGFKDKAISMYERLMVANPEKSAIFAAAIEELKK